MIRPLSMGLRIAGNLVAGHVILGILGVAFLELIKTLSPSHSIFLIIANIPMNVITCLAYTTILYFECAVAIIQAYVLTLLTSTFLKEVEEMH
jgi:F0F1-type ATP synthase membrane subunit a